MLSLFNVESSELLGKMEMEEPIHQIVTHIKKYDAFYAVGDTQLY